MKPILFSTAMVQAILGGRKTQTRRVVKTIDARGFRTSYAPFEDFYGRVFKCPYGQPGDVLWVRETWCYTGSNEYLNLQTNLPFFYKADVKDSSTEKEVMNHYGWKWKPSIHMPREAARLFLRITNVRVERLQEISPESCIAEGLYTTLREHDAVMQLQDQWRDLWQSINGQESWEANPWVWVVEFERITKEEAKV
jgi:hypothetical protein